MRDIEGLTPILRAVHCGQIWLVTKLVGRYPESKDMRDLKGRNMWHYLCSSTSRLSNGVDYLNSVLKAWEDVSMSSDEPISTKFSQDDDGNTPLHLAIIYQNFEVAQYFMKHIVKKEMLLEKPAHPMAIMGDAFYEAAKEGDIEKLTSLPFGWTRRLRDGSNVIHVALWHHQIPFIAMLLSKHLEHVFTLLYLKDYKGDTPLHLAAQLPATEALSFFELCFNHWTSDDDLQKRPPPWMERNIKGNTFLHEAARFCNYQVIFSGLVDGIDNEDVNDNGETVLHVIARYATNAENLSEEMQYVIYLQDLEGFTPVLRAVQCGRLGVARLLIQQCPHSIGIPDKKGRTVLHHLRAMVVDLVDEVRDVLPVWNDFFKYCHLDDLRTVQNEDGNTALHSAIIDGDVNKVKFLMEKCFQSESKRELGIVNNNGQTVFDLVSSQAHKELLPLVNRSYVKERELMDNVMDDVLYQAAINGDIQIFEPTAKDVSTNDEESRPPICTDAYFCSQTPGGSSIIHIALRHGQKNIVKFIETALEKYPILSMRPDSNGDTPLHLAAKWKTGVSIVISLIEASKILLQTLDESKKAFHVAPWAVKNCKGCFPIHEALQTGNLDAAYALLDCDTEAASRVNDLGDTALHSFAKNGFSVVNDEADKFVKTLLNKINQAAYKRDNEGLTPLLSAARSGRIQVAHAILKYRPQSAYLRDPNGRTFLHLLRFTGEDVDESLGGTFENTGKQLFESPEADAQRLVQDYEGDTALHHAIKTQNSVAAIVLTQRCLDDDERRELGLVNKEGHTIPDLLASHDVPNEIIELIQKKVPKAVYLARSSYGIRKSEMKESANALALVAALLATMTFAAAFQVPGGNGDDGFPILFSKVAFVIFSVANTIAMCSSMLCLFILLWVMGIGKIHGSLKILDISIILLRVSFYLTLLTFTTSVFVVTVEKSLWMGIFVYVLGSLTFLLTFKVSIKTVAKYGGITSTGIKNFIN
ncbi:Ankyrin repeat-containing protein NPR4, partial [Bienertia sinuspersici]